jgi:hypothetical protein
VDNYLSAEPLIIARLKAVVTELGGNVFSAADLDGVNANSQITPAAHVLYYGDRVAQGNGRSSTGECQCTDQVWYVVLAVRNAASQETGEDARLEAGILLKKIMKALQGWQPSPEHGYLIRGNGPAPGFKAGFAYFPILFTTRVTV